jgi:hypothetical protein
VYLFVWISIQCVTWMLLHIQLRHKSQAPAVKQMETRDTSIVKIFRWAELARNSANPVQCLCPFNAFLMSCYPTFYHPSVLRLSAPGTTGELCLCSADLQANRRLRTGKLKLISANKCEEKIATSPQKLRFCNTCYGLISRRYGRCRYGGSFYI